MENIHAPLNPISCLLPATGKVTVEAQGHLLKVVFQSRQDVPLSGGLRGSILKFTSRSRKRMLETLARLDESRMGFVCFVTLTPKTGRHWGIFNRKKLPLANPSSLSLTGGEWYNQAKEIAGEIFPPVLDNPYLGGFTLFTERAEELKEIFTLLANGEGDE